MNAKMGQQGAPRAKFFFSKNDPGPNGMPKQVFLARFRLMVACFGPLKITKWLVNGLFCDQNWVNNVFSPQMIQDHLGCANK